jgi:hypothetical protein
VNKLTISTVLIKKVKFSDLNFSGKFSSLDTTQRLTEASRQMSGTGQQDSGRNKTQGKGEGKEGTGQVVKEKIANRWR